MNIVITQAQAIEQLYNMINPLIPLGQGWNPFTVELDDYDVKRWVHDSNNSWCSGKREDFIFLAGNESYVVGNYAKAVLDVLGILIR